MDSRREMEQAWAAFQSGQLELAGSLLQNIVQREQTNVPAKIALGMVFARTGRSTEAIALMQAALTLDKRCLPALNWLTVLSLEIGDGDRALEYSARAEALSADDGEILVLRARSLMAAGRAQEALSYYDRAISKRPQDATARFGRADALETLSRESEAVKELKKALKHEPNAQGFAKQAHLLLVLGFPREALESARKAVELDSSLRSGYVLLARALTEEGMLAEADPHWETARLLEAEPGRTSCEKALALKAVGRFEEAIAGFKQSIEENPRQGMAYYSLVYSKRITEEDRPFLDQIERVRNDSDLNPETSAQLDFALGKSYDNLADYGTAMNRYDDANLILLKQLRKNGEFDRRNYSEVIDHQIKLFTEFHSVNAGSGSEMPIFVIGMMRSGTTLVEQILSCHSRVGAGGEQPFWVDRYPNLVKGEIIDRSALARSATEYLSLLEAVAPGNSYVVDKNPANYLVAGFIHSALPNARIIHVRRHPVDTAISIWTTRMGTPAPFMFNKENIVFAYKEYVRLMQHWREILPASLFLEIDYEELVDDAENSIRRMLNFCNLPWEETCLHPEQNTRTVRTPSYWQVRQPINKESKDRWKRYEPWIGEFAELLRA